MIQWFQILKHGRDEFRNGRVDMNRIPDGGVRFPGLYDIDNRVNGFIALYTQDSGAKYFFGVGINKYFHEILFLLFFDTGNAAHRAFAKLNNCCFNSWSAHRAAIEGVACPVPIIMTSNLSLS